MSQVSSIKPSSFPWFRYEGYSFSLGLTDGSTSWLSGHSASEFDEESGHIVVRGDMSAQAETAYAKIGIILEAAGMQFSDVIRVVENVTTFGVDSYAEAAKIRRQVFGESRPTVVTVIVDRLLRPKAQIEIEVTASLGGANRTTVNGSVNGGIQTVNEAADGTVYLPTILPIDSRGEIVAAGNFEGQYRYCLERAAELLSTVGLTLENVVKTLDYSTPETRDQYRNSVGPRKDMLGPVYPSAAGILMERMHSPGVLVSLDVFASRHELIAVNPGWKRYETLTYNPAIKAGKMLFISGFAALDHDTQKPLYLGDVVAQAEYTYESIIEVLEAAGADATSLIKTIEYVCPEALPTYKGVAEVRKKLLSSPWPASTGAVCRALLRPEFLIEVDSLAVLP